MNSQTISFSLLRMKRLNKLTSKIITKIENALLKLYWFPYVVMLFDTGLLVIRFNYLSLEMNWKKHWTLWANALSDSNQITAGFITCNPRHANTILINNRTRLFVESTPLTPVANAQLFHFQIQLCNTSLEFHWFWWNCYKGKSK